MNLVKKFLANDIVERAIKTFVQAALATLAVTGFQLNKAVLVAAAAAGFSAVWNYLRNLSWGA